MRWSLPGRPLHSRIAMKTAMATMTAIAAPKNKLLATPMKMSNVQTTFCEFCQ